VKKKRANKSAFVRDTVMAAVGGQEQLVAWGHRRISYRIMTDITGKKWDVPMSDEVIPHDPARWRDLADKTWLEIKTKRK
jgi:hypothetical protein